MAENRVTPINGISILKLFVNETRPNKKNIYASKPIIPVSINMARYEFQTEFQ